MKTGVPPVGGDVGTTVNIGVVVGDEWTTGVNVAVNVKTGDGGGVVGAVGLGPDDAVNDIGGVIVGVGGRPAKDGRPLDRKSMIATTASMTPGQLRAWTPGQVLVSHGSLLAGNRARCFDGERYLSDDRLGGDGKMHRPPNQDGRSRRVQVRPISWGRAPAVGGGSRPGFAPSSGRSISGRPDSVGVK